VGVSLVKGDFTRGDMVLILDSHGQTIARGLVNYSSPEALKIMGLASNAIEATLGYVAEPELIHRDNLVLL
jgi:glutamate 5-kinase